MANVKGKPKAGGRDFPKGRSPNPGGRPKGVTEVMKLLREEHLHGNVPNVLRKLYTQAIGGNVFAAKEYLDRLLGKATQPVEMSGPDGGPIPSGDAGVAPELMTSEQKIQRIRELALKAGMMLLAAETATKDPGQPDGGTK